MRNYPIMKKLILALAAMLITAPAAAASNPNTHPWYYDGLTKDETPACVLFLRYSAPPQPGETIPDFNTVVEENNAGVWCVRAVLHWLHDTRRHRVEYGGYTDKEIALGRCGAQIILRYNDDTPIADALAAEFDTACGEAPAIM